MTWQRRGLLAERRPILDEEALEHWIGASRQGSLPDSLPRYLFSGFGDVDSIGVTVATRWTIVLVLSGAALSCGLLLIYFPRWRHPAMLFSGGVATLAAMLAVPDLAVATAQASLLGLILAVIAWALKSVVDYRETRRSVVRGVRLTGSDSKTARAAALTASKADVAAPLPSTTAMVPIEFPLGEPAP
jgi:hypothetical protein